MGLDFVHLQHIIFIYNLQKINYNCITKYLLYYLYI